MSPGPRRADPHRAVRWSGASPLPGAARERLLEAAAGCVARDGLAALSMAGVAEEAGVSRPTVYRYFADRGALLEATLLFAGRALADAVGEQVRRYATPAQKAVEAVLFARAEVLRDPVLGALWRATLLDAFAVAGATRPAAVDWSRHALKDLVQAAGWNREQADEAIETMLRMLLSLLAAPEPRREDDELRGFLARRLVPALGLAAPAQSAPAPSRRRPARR